MNVIDLCPVGALTNKDFRFKQRVWFLKLLMQFVMVVQKDVIFMLTIEKKNIKMTKF